MKPVLQTRRLKLKPISKNDAENLQKIFSSEFVRKYLFDDEILSRRQIEEFIEISDGTFAENNYGLWAIARIEEPDEFIGVVGLWHFFEESEAQLLYALLPDFAGKGLATEAAKEVVRYAFNKLDYERLAASCDAPNTDSQKVMRRLGMKKFSEETIDGKSIVFYEIRKLDFEK